ncbi:hypothetical protein ACLOJK_017787 [Asimina triloba]
MARSLLNANLLSAVADGVSLAITRYVVFRSHRVLYVTETVGSASYLCWSVREQAVLFDDIPRPSFEPGARGKKRGGEDGGREGEEGNERCQRGDFVGAGPGDGLLPPGEPGQRNRSRRVEADVAEQQALGRDAIETVYETDPSPRLKEGIESRIADSTGFGR